MSQNVMPEEGVEHACTWMGFPSSESIWGRELLRGAQRNIALIAKTISKYEPVHILINAKHNDLFQELLDEIGFSGFHEIVKVDRVINDLWLRDTGPIFLQNNSAVNFNFNGWGKKQKHNHDSQIAEFICQHQNLEKIVSTFLVLEGGAIEVDGKGTAICTESCSLNKNRNRAVSKRQLEEELNRVLGVRKIIWLPGVKGADITDAHTDFYARFVGNHNPATVLLHADPDDPDTQINRLILESALDAEGRQIRVVNLNSPGLKRVRNILAKEKDAALGYVNFYVCNGAVIMPEFGDVEADENARNVLQECYPGRVIEQINIDSIAIGGGGVHCCTQQQIKY